MTLDPREPKLLTKPFTATLGPILTALIGLGIIFIPYKSVKGLFVTRTKFFCVTSTALIIVAPTVLVLGVLVVLMVVVVAVVVLVVLLLVVVVVVEIGTTASGG